MQPSRRTVLAAFAAMPLVGAALRENFAGPLIIGRDLMEV
jgi:hypothetical protein